LTDRDVPDTEPSGLHEVTVVETLAGRQAPSVIRPFSRKPSRSRWRSIQPTASAMFGHTATGLEG
jgi:hypothetical protein